MKWLYSTGQQKRIIPPTSDSATPGSALTPMPLNLKLTRVAVSVAYGDISASRKQKTPANTGVPCQSLKTFCHAGCKV
jgi:hypothetical protein